MGMDVVTIRGVIARRLREEARKLDLSPEEYVRAALELLEGTREELERGNVRQAAEKVWGAAALALRAYALWREGRRLASHGELWEYKSTLADEWGGWVRVAFQQASSMHVCFYEGWCDRGDVEEALKSVRRLVEEISRRVGQTE